MIKAYLITAYHQPLHLKRLIEALQHERAVFYVHIDAKVKIYPFKEAVGGRGDVRFVKSHKVNWMGFSQVESILELMNAAIAGGCDYISLLSGSDYPIKSTDYIMDFFGNAREEFINFWRLEDRPSWLHKIDFYYPIDLVPIKNYETAGFRRYWWGYYYKLLPYMPLRRRPNFVPYGGSDWWSMSADCAKYVLEYVKKNPKYVSFYRYTHCPSEMFFQSIVLNSEYATRVRNYHQYENWRRDGTAEEQPMLPEDSFNLRYIDWSGFYTGKRKLPAVMDERDFEALKKSPDLFARKFEEATSEKLIWMIDDQLRLATTRQSSPFE